MVFFGCAPRAVGVGAQAEDERAWRVANAVPGYAAQPDYDAMAADLRGRVVVLGSVGSGEQACEAMHEAVVAYYERLGSEDALDMLRATTSENVAGCARTLSESAARCVPFVFTHPEVLAPGEVLEAAFVVDQCARAFPRVPQRQGP